MAILWQLPRLARDRGFNAESLAQATGLPFNQLEGWLNQQLMPPLSAHDLDRLCQVLHCQPGDLLVSALNHTVQAGDGETVCLDALLDAKLQIFHEEMTEHLTRMHMGDEEMSEDSPTPVSLSDR